MKSHCDNGQYDSSHYVDHTKQAVMLRLQPTDHQRRIHYEVTNKLDDCLLMLADGHDQVMEAMIEELRDIVYSGYAREDTEPHHQEQHDHSLISIAHALQLSPAATASLACTDAATLRELAIKVGKQHARASAAETALSLTWGLAQPKSGSREKCEELQGLLPRCTHQCQSPGCSEQCIYDTYHSQGMQPNAYTHKCSNLDCGRKCTQSVEETGGADIRGCQHTSDEPQSISNHLTAPQVELSVSSEATTGHRAAVYSLAANFLRPIISTLRKIHGMTGLSYITATCRRSLAELTRATMQRLREPPTTMSKMRHNRSPQGQAAEDSDDPRGLEVPQARSTAATYATMGNSQQERPLRSKQAGLYITDTRCSECDKLVELGDVGYEDDLCNDCVDESARRYWGPPGADQDIEDDASSRGPHGDN